jgi:flavorubredoxin
MDTRLDEIADGIYRISTHVAPPAALSGLPAPEPGVTVNQFVVMADEPLLFHTGPRASFPEVLVALGRVLPPSRLRWVSFGHVEDDECGALDQVLAAAPQATVTFAVTSRSAGAAPDGAPPGRPAPSSAVDLGGRRVVPVATPHAPHSRDAQVLYEETTGTLLCGDLFTQLGRGPAVTADDLVDAALAAESVWPSAPPGPAVPEALRRLAGLRPTTVATMHGSAFEGDGAGALHDLADGWEQCFGRWVATPVLEVDAVR